MRIDQIPDQPLKLQNFILSLKDGATFTIPQMRKATGFSWHTCNHFIQKWPQRFRPSIIGRGKGLGRPFVYKLLSNGPELQIQLPAVSPTDEGWNRLPKVRKIKTLEALFPDGIKPEHYERLFRIIELLNQMHALVWNQEDT